MLGEACREWPLSDEDVVRRILAGEHALFEVIMRRYNRRLYRVAFAILRDEAEAEDVMQQAYVNAYRHLAQFENKAKFSTWLTKIAVYEAQARARRRKRFVAVDGPQDSERDVMGSAESKTPSPEQEALTIELRGLLESAIEALPEHYRSVFVMREVEEMSTIDTAACLDLTEETVKTRLHRARHLLRQRLYQSAGMTARTAFAFQAPRCDRMVQLVFTQIATPQLSAAGPTPQ